MTFVVFSLTVHVDAQLSSKLGTQELAVEDFTGSNCETVETVLNNKVKDNYFISEKDET